MSKKIIALLTIFITVPVVANAGWFGSMLGGNDNAATAAAVNVASNLIGALSPEEAAKKVIDKCMVPTTDGICECVANATFGNLTMDQWKIVNHYIFDTRATVSSTSFLMANPWLVTKLATPYFQCSGKK